MTLRWARLCILPGSISRILVTVAYLIDHTRTKKKKKKKKNSYTYTRTYSP